MDIPEHEDEMRGERAIPASEIKAARRQAGWYERAPYWRVHHADSQGGCLFDRQDDAEREVADLKAEDDADLGLTITEEWRSPAEVEAMPEFDGDYA